MPVIAPTTSTPKPTLTPITFTITDAESYRE